MFSFTAGDEEFMSTQIPSPVPLTEILSNSSNTFPAVNTINDEEPFPVMSWEDMDAPGALIEDGKKQKDLDDEGIEKKTASIPINSNSTVQENMYASPQTNVEKISNISRFPGENSEFVISPTSKDVISARGCGRSHAGNVRFRNLITQNKHAYDSNSSEEFRRSLALKVANEIKPGRFLKKDTNQEVYKVMPFEKMITKITFAMRDCKSHVSMGRRKAFETTRTKATVAPRQKRKAAPKTKSE